MPHPYAMPCHTAGSANRLPPRAVPSLPDPFPSLVISKFSKCLMQPGPAIDCTRVYMLPVRLSCGAGIERGAPIRLRGRLDRYIARLKDQEGAPKGIMRGRLKDEASGDRWKAEMIWIFPGISRRCQRVQVHDLCIYLYLYEQLAGMHDIARRPRSSYTSSRRWSWYCCCGKPRDSRVDPILKAPSARE